ncbi:hypothetical protein [Deinococcus sp. Leaf326]|uniref:hypothetical protein n=1 Tax=Deinococcus sp. Leaf326 TaxID=1736338 RepID=UPI0006F58BDF|nr:hypothetical protein [Deinococcus sp. Leaf326]KQR18792.1 hypothetical protein ASF71_19875 [Deinococcus sp. Leaf326]
MTQLTPHELNDVLDRYAMVRDTIQGLESERDELGKLIKDALQQGQTAQTPLYRAELRGSRSLEYPADRFREAFGDAATLEVASIDRKKADALVKVGDLDGEVLSNLAITKERSPSLVLVPLT